jgi:hypothetical protein
MKYSQSMDIRMQADINVSIVTAYTVAVSPLHLDQAQALTTWDRIPIERKGIRASIQVASCRLHRINNKKRAISSRHMQAVITRASTIATLRHDGHKVQVMRYSLT